MTLKQVKVKWLLFIVIALFVAGCSNNQASSGNESTSAAQKDGGTLNIAFQSEPTTLDPQITGNSSVKDAARSTIFQGFWTSGGAPVEKSTKYLDKIKAAASVKDARPAIDATQKYVWEELPFTLIGHKVNINAVSRNVKGYDFNLGPVFYNVSVNK
ncbi:hypothetical protein P2R53_25980 [Priestia megaterium]|nr:hypothetical protein [Priestia megaterium]MDF2015204.1 hypothetical protein [Priestia megaterium]